MPLFYGDLSALDSHFFTRENSSLFDVSHMLQYKISGPEHIPFYKNLVVADLEKLQVGKSTLSLYLNPKGGISDDIIITKHQDHLFVVSNAGCALKDWTHINNFLSSKPEFSGKVKIEKIDSHSLIALQGPRSANVLQQLCDDFDLSKLKFMSAVYTSVYDIPVHLTRSGYTGEDVEALAEKLLSFDKVKLAGLAPRDSLRLEAGLCLYGHDIDDTTTPIEASLLWTIPKSNRVPGNFIGSDVLFSNKPEFAPQRRRIGLIVQGAPAR
ncbi:hypothetical protein BB560_006127, partial [Smittium megazygosporum]